MNNRKRIVLISILVLVFGFIMMGKFCINILDSTKIEPRLVNVISDAQNTTVQMTLLNNGSQKIVDYKVILNYEPEDLEAIDEFYSETCELLPGEEVELEFIFPIDKVQSIDVDMYNLWFRIEGYIGQRTKFNHFTSEGDLNAFIYY